MAADQVFRDDPFGWRAITLPFLECGLDACKLAGGQAIATVEYLAFEQDDLIAQAVGLDIVC